MAKKAKPPSPFEGRWRITSMEMWSQDVVDAEVEGFVEFEPNGLGNFQFAYVSGDIDYRDSTRDGKPSVEWSWDGNDEMDPGKRARLSRDRRGRDSWRHRHSPRRPVRVRGNAQGPASPKPEEAKTMTMEAATPGYSHTGRTASGLVDLGRQRRDGPGAGPRLGCGEGRPTAPHDLHPPGRRLGVAAKAPNATKRKKHP
jgi:hypothetical protein